MQNSTFEVTDLKTYFWSELTVEDLNTIADDEAENSSIGPIIELFADGVNDEVEANDLGLKLAKPSSEDISESKLYIYDGFLLI